MKLFMKLFGTVLLGFGAILIASMYLGLIAASIYIILMPFTVLQVESGLDIFVIVMGVLMLLVTLTGVWFTIDALINTNQIYPIALMPKSKQPNKRKPILP